MEFILWSFLYNMEFSQFLSKFNEKNLKNNIKALKTRKFESLRSLALITYVSEADSETMMDFELFCWISYFDGIGNFLCQDNF